MARRLHHLKMTRRRFVGSGCALASAAMTSLPATARSSTAATLIVLIDDIPDDMDPSLVEWVLSEFLDRGIPVSCVVDVARTRDATATKSSDHIVATIRAVLARETGLMEIVAETGDGAEERRYFQMRAAEDLRAAAAAFTGEAVSVSGQTQIVSMIHRQDEFVVDLAAYRSAGFRVLIRPGNDDPMTTEFVGRGQMRLSGGSALGLSGSLPETRTRLDDILSEGADTMLVLSVADMAAGGTSILRQEVTRIANRIDDALRSGAVIAMRPMDLLLGAGPYQSADRAIVLSGAGTGAENAALASFSAALRDGGLPFTATGDVAPDWLADGEDFCPGWSADTPHPGHAGENASGCLLLPASSPEPQPDWVPGLTLFPGAGGAWNGVRSDGRMRLVYLDWAGVGSAEAAPLADIVLVIRATDVMTPQQRQSVLYDLSSAVWEGRIRLHTVADLADLVVAPEPVYTRLWSTRRRMVTDPPRSGALNAHERAALAEDARLAWRFIERFTDSATGLCAGTVRDGPGRRVNLEASLWDIGSQLQGIVAARSLEIIPEDEARGRVQTMLENLPSIALGELRLPPAMFTTDAAARVAVRGFDICDTGRFLIALRSAVAAGLATEEQSRETRARWDLDAVVQDGRVFNISGNRRVDVTMSHCTPYMARAFADLDMPLRSPYAQLDEQADTDALIRLLYSAAFVGSFATEPLLLEAIEQGASAELAFLSAVLFDAQLSWFENTGQLKCISEAPLNFEPWFIFQGLRVDRLGEDAWTFQTPNAASEYQSAEFRERVEVLSAKSAYLWAAVHPHPYSDMLLHLMRDKARIDNLGFSVGVFTHTQEAMVNYSDLNTNGIILSAIARMLDPSWPGSR